MMILKSKKEARMGFFLYLPCDLCGADTDQVAAAGSPMAKGCMMR